MGIHLHSKTKMCENLVLIKILLLVVTICESNTHCYYV
nr:MAG TPA: hypothetical protein [Caudoviricetes sp.]DAQ87446.1 MAG TPA: hypothetical protein [Caudoviricetes sp.]DAT03974.1 MAG TPA: hypothetical protein [Caudoviricetes sp.]